MISVERSFYEKFPRLADGQARSFAQPVVGLLRRIACEERINALLADDRAADRFRFRRARARTCCRSATASPTPTARTSRSTGRVVIVANHPLGALDALALMHLVGSVRRDVKVLANDVLMQIAPLAPLLLPLPVFGAASPLGGARAAYRALERDEALIVFPSGRGLAHARRRACAIAAGRPGSRGWR